MDAYGITSGYAFSRNPIVLHEKYPDNTFDRKGGCLRVYVSGSEIFEGRFSPPLHIDLSEIIDAHLSPFREPEINNAEPIVELYDYGTLRDDGLVNVVASYGNIESQFECVVVPGGISNQNFRRYAAIGSDVFDTRLFNPEGNFFWTTRTAEWLLTIKETELYPVCFFVRHFERIDIVAQVSGDRIYRLSFDGLVEGIHFLNIDALRHKFMNQFGILANIFDVYAAGKHSCRIVVRRSDISKDRCRVKFRNSFGVFEIIELTGKPAISPEWSAGEDATFKRCDSATGMFYTDRERVECSRSVTVESGIKRPDEIRFMLDMLGSEEVYLLDMAPLPVRVIPYAEEFSYGLRPDLPENFKLRFDIADSEYNMMQDINDGTEHLKPRIFTKQFSKQFN